jgi:hypothetical protein
LCGGRLFQGHALVPFGVHLKIACVCQGIFGGNVTLCSVWQAATAQDKVAGRFSLAQLFVHAQHSGSCTLSKAFALNQAANFQRFFSLESLPTMAESPLLHDQAVYMHV